MNQTSQNSTLTGDPSFLISTLENPHDHPLDLFQTWLDTADRLKIVESRGIVLATVNSHNQPSTRVVLIKDVNDQGIVFGSSSLGQKSKDWDSHPYTSGTLWWRETMSQIHMQGIVSQLSGEISDQLFYARTRDAQAVAVASAQSAYMKDEQELRSRVKELIQKPGLISRPPTWHAYQLVVQKMEFWQGSLDRFHHRLLYEFKNDCWGHHKLQP